MDIYIYIESRLPGPRIFLYYNIIESFENK